jgi:hypothetical protein
MKCLPGLSFGHKKSPGKNQDLLFFALLPSKAYFLRGAAFFLAAAFLGAAFFAAAFLGAAFFAAAFLGAAFFGAAFFAAAFFFVAIFLNLSG